MRQIYNISKGICAVKISWNTKTQVCCCTRIFKKRTKCSILDWNQCWTIGLY